MKKIFNIIVFSTLMIYLFSSCNDIEELSSDVVKLEAVPLKMELQKNSIISGDSLFLIFKIDDPLVKPKRDIPISLSVTDENGKDASEYFLGFTELVSFPSGEKELIIKYQLSKIKLPKLVVDIQADSEATEILNNSAKITISNSTFSEIISFKIGSSEASIIQDDRNIHIELPTGTDISSLTPELKVSADATYEPLGAQDFTVPVIYTVLAQDGITSIEYTVIVEVAKNKDASLWSFITGGFVGVIDDLRSSITVNIPDGTNIKGLTPDVIPAFGATYQIDNNICTVTAEDGITSRNYSIKYVNKTFVPKMAYVENGIFIMGEGGDAGEFEATISRDMYVAIFQTSWKDYSKVLGPDRGSITSFKEVGENVPMTQTSFYDAADFCNELSILEGLEPYYLITDRVNLDWRKNLKSASVSIKDPNGKGYRLLTEAEWEFIARGGNKTQGFTYPGSNIKNEVGWSFYNHSKEFGNWGSPSRGGLLKANELGVYDMMGNVYERCWDWYAESYSTMPAVDPLGPNEGTVKVTRGGFFYNKDEQKTLKVWERGFQMKPDATRNDAGFRVVRNK